MNTQDKLAAATIAKIFGSEMLYVQQNAKTDGGATPNVSIMHPRDILQNNTSPNIQYSSQQEKRIIEALQREAESACPLPQETHSQPAPATAPPVAAPPIQNAASSAAVQNVRQEFATVPPTVQQVRVTEDNVWERIALSLEKIAHRLDSIDFSVKKVRKSRRKIQQ